MNVTAVATSVAVYCIFPGSRCDVLLEIVLLVSEGNVAWFKTTFPVIIHITANVPKFKNWTFLVDHRMLCTNVYQSVLHFSLQKHCDECFSAFGNGSSKNTRWNRIC